MTLSPGVSRIRSGRVRIGTTMVFFLTALSLTAGCASKPPLTSLAPGPTIDHGFPGVSVSEGQSQWPKVHGPAEETNHRIYTEAPPPLKKAPPLLQKTVYFSFNSARLSYWDEVVLDRVAQALKGRRYRVVLLHGSTDPMGSEAYNKKLGLRRSLSVKRYLVSRGIAARKLQPLSWGDRKARLFSACRKKSPLCHSQSRSVRIDIIWEKGASLP
ncbi:MAG: OmpA family protein [Leptospirillum sp. Group IV 'UBA BS']|nr:MAG: OmpA family protein [Leptospirillum sp. Group IV 'UBA BS']